MDVVNPFARRLSRAQRGPVRFDFGVLSLVVCGGINSRRHVSLIGAGFWYDSTQIIEVEGCFACEYGTSVVVQLIWKEAARFWPVIHRVADGKGTLNKSLLAML